MIGEAISVQELEEFLLENKISVPKG